MLLCDLCDRSFHVACLPHPLKEIPNGEWHCNQCSRGFFDAYTAWINLSYYKRGLGTLCVLPRAHYQMQEFDRTLPTRPDLPKDYQAIVKKSTAVWHRLPDDAIPGDLVLFNVKMVHATTKNNSNCYCMSLDTRVFARNFCPEASQRKMKTNIDSNKKNDNKNK